MSSKQEDWIARRIREAGEPKGQAVTAAVMTRMSDLLKGKASEAPLKPKDVSAIANSLLQDMTSLGTVEGESES